MKDVEIRKLYRESEQYADHEITVSGWIRTNGVRTSLALSS